MAKKTHELRIKLSADELQRLQKKAASVGLAVSSFARMVLLSSKVSVEQA